MLQVHTLKSAYGSKHSVKRIGRGNASGHGTSSTRGGKGQTARSGGSRGLRLKGFKRLLQSTPKLRGFTSIANRPEEVYLSDIEKKFKEGEEVTLAALIAKNMVSVNVKSAKILGGEEFNKKVVVVGLKATKGAAEKIKAAGGELK